MMNTNDENAQSSKQLLTVIGSGVVVIALIVLGMLWRNYQLTGNESWLSAAGRAISDLLPSPVRGAAGEQAQLMGLPLTSDSSAYWYLARAGGIIAYLLLWLATCWGIMMSSKVIKGVVGTPVAYALHEFLPLLGVVFAAFHALVLLGDSYIDFAPWHLLVPFSGPYKPLWTGLGILAFYLSVALIASFYVRKRIGQKTWRALHYLTYLAFVMTLLHGVMAGSDSKTMVMQAVYSITGGLSIFLLFYRLLAYTPRLQRAASRRPASGD
jgi:predicted ferric reductase